MKCSVIIPCYNHGSQLHVAVDSVLNQTYKNFEIIIVVDGALDNSHKIAKDLAAKNPIIRVYHIEHSGREKARNYGIKQAIGEVILPLDADDKIAPLYMEKAMRYFEGNNKDLIVYCNAAFFGAKSGSWKLDAYTVNGLCLYNMIFSSAFYRKTAWERVGGYDCGLNGVWEDWDFWLSMVSKGSEVVKIEEELFFYYVRSGPTGNTISEEFKRYAFDYIWGKHKLFIANHIVNPLILNYKKHKLKAELKGLRNSRIVKIARIMKVVKYRITTKLKDRNQLFI